MTDEVNANNTFDWTIPPWDKGNIIMRGPKLPKPTVWTIIDAGRLHWRKIRWWF
jgi:hypothetical protein